MARLCAIMGCDRDLFARGWCQTHYGRWRRTGDPLTPRGPHGPQPGDGKNQYTALAQCRNGHLFTEENTVRDARGCRHCRACQEARSDHRYSENRTIYLAAKGDSCTSCGQPVTDPKDLHFHHVDPDEKRAEVGNLLWASERAVLNEIAKCQVLCRDCHLEVHRG